MSNYATDQKPHVGMKITGIDAKGVRGPAEIVRISDSGHPYHVRFAFEHQTESGTVCPAGWAWRLDCDGDIPAGLRIEFTPFVESEPTPADLLRQALDSTTDSIARRHIEAAIAALDPPPAWTDDPALIEALHSVARGTERVASKTWTVTRDGKRLIVEPVA